VAILTGILVNIGRNERQKEGRREQQGKVKKQTNPICS
jgi:hypothetical protein